MLRLPRMLLTRSLPAEACRCKELFAPDGFAERCTDCRGVSLAVLQRVNEVDGDVTHLHRTLVHAGTLHTVIEHDVAERAGGGHAGGTGGDGFTGSFVVHLGADVLFHPHAGTTGSAAHALGSVAWHFDYLDSFDRSHDLSRRQVHIVVAAEVAGVVVSDAVIQ